MAEHRVIEDYLFALDGRLRPIAGRRRCRILAEARDHLVDSAQQHGIATALARFGEPSDVAASHLDAAASSAARRALVVFGSGGAAVAAVQVLASPVTFGLFPGGPWPDDIPPSYLAWKTDLAGLLFVAAALLGGLAVAQARRGRRPEPDNRRRVTYLAAAGCMLFLASAPIDALFLFQRSAEVPGSPAGWVVALIGGGFGACALVAAFAVLQALRLVRATPIR